MARRLFTVGEGAAGAAAVWRGQDLARRSGRVCASGHAALDAELPGGGWPQGGLVELLQPDADGPFWQLLLPALARTVACERGPVVLVAPPHAPFAPALAAQGLPGERLLCVRARQNAPRVWAAEQALRCADVAAVLAWLPQARDAELRRLQLLAQERERLLFVLRDARAAQGGSPAQLRLRLEATPEALQVHLLKRRGPPLARPIAVPLQAARLQALLALRQGVAVPQPTPVSLSPERTRLQALRIVSQPLAARPAASSAEFSSHALDRTAAP